MGLDVAIVAVFFVSFWGVNAEPLGRHDAGVALALALAVPCAIYASLGLAVLGVLMTGLALVRRLPFGIYLSGLVVSLLPIGYLLLLDARLVPSIR